MTKPMKKQKKAVSKAPVAPPVAHKPPTGDPKYLKSLFDQSQAHWDEQAEHYGWEDQKPDVVTARLQAILGAPSNTVGLELQRKAHETMQIMLLGAWARGKIPGPRSRLSLERRIKQAESLVKMLEAKGQHDAAQTQRDRADALRDQLANLEEATVDIA